MGRGAGKGNVPVGGKGAIPNTLDGIQDRGQNSWRLVIARFCPLLADVGRERRQSFPCPLVSASRIGREDVEQLAYSINDTAKALSLGRTSIYALIGDGKLDTFKLGRRTLIKADSIRRLVAGQE